MDLNIFLSGLFLAINAVFMKNTALLFIFCCSFYVSFGQTPAVKTFPALPPSTEEKSADNFIQEAIAHFDGGRYQQSVNTINEAMAINQEGQLSDILFYYRALNYLKLEQLAKAKADLDTAINFNDQKPHYYYHRGTIFLKNGQSKAAYSDFDNVLKLEPRYEEAWMKKGILLQQSQRNREALIAYNKALELNDKNAEAYYFRALIMLQVGMPDKGCSDLETAADLGYRPAEKAQRTYCQQ